MRVLILFVLIAAIAGGFVPTRNTPQGAWFHGYGYGRAAAAVLAIALLVAIMLIWRGKL